MALPRYTGLLERHRMQEAKQMLIAVLEAQRRYQLENGVFANGPVEGARLDIPLTATIYFQPPRALNNPDDVSDMWRNGNLYRVSITDQGLIYCLNSPANCSNAGCSGPAGVGFPPASQSQQCL